jgi:hypothetical protein
MMHNEPDEPEGRSRETANQELEGRDEELQRGRSNLQPKCNGPGRSLPGNEIPGPFSSRGRTRTYDPLINSQML